MITCHKIKKKMVLFCDYNFIKWYHIFVSYFLMMRGLLNI